MTSNHTCPRHLPPLSVTLRTWSRVKSPLSIILCSPVFWTPLIISRWEANSLDHLGALIPQWACIKLGCYISEEWSKHKRTFSTLKTGHITLPWKPFYSNREQWGFNQLCVLALTHTQSCFLQVVLRPSSGGCEYYGTGNSVETVTSLAPAWSRHTCGKLSSATRTFNYQLLLEILFWEDSPWSCWQTLGLHGPVIAIPQTWGRIELNSYWQIKTFNK